jgi:hypothetical protein
MTRHAKLRSATDAALLAEWSDLQRSQQDALAAAHQGTQGWTIYGGDTNGGAVQGLRHRELLDAHYTLRPRGVLVREVGMRKRSGR